VRGCPRLLDRNAWQDTHRNGEARGH
jgi:hypothetical protein